jgi:hypothetical protein
VEKREDGIEKAGAKYLIPSPEGKNPRSGRMDYKLPCEKKEERSRMDQCEKVMKKLRTADGKCLVPAKYGGCKCPMKYYEINFLVDVEREHMGPLISMYWRGAKASLGLSDGLKQTNQHLMFDKFWTLALNQSFSGPEYNQFMTSAPGVAAWKMLDKEATKTRLQEYEAYLNRAQVAPACVGGGWCVDPKTGLKSGVRKECEGQQAQSWGSPKELWNTTPLNMGLDFLVSNGNEFVMRQRMAGLPVKYCASQVKWNFCVCEGCKCKDLFNVKLQHTMRNMTKDDAGGRCADWFKNIDAAIRAYTSSVRAAILSLKNACCSPWTPKNNKKGQCVQGFVTGQGAKASPFQPYGFANGIPHQARIWDDLEKSVQEPKYRLLNTHGRRQGYIYAPIRDCAGVICKNENFSYEDTEAMVETK